MASMADGRCTCPEVWHGTTERPDCVVHEQDPRADADPRVEADRRIARLRAVNRAGGRPKDPDGMGGDNWTAWP